MEVASCVQFVSGCLVLSGAPGTGKSTLVRAARDAAGDRTILAAPGHADERQLPYAGLQRLLAPLLDQHPAPDLLIAAVEGRYVPARLPLGLAVLDVLRAAARQRPVLILADDAHLLDEPTWAVLTFVARRTGADPIALVATVPAGHPTTGLPTRRLGPLDGPAARALLDAQAPGLPDDLAAALIDLAGGNPAALADLARTVTPAQRRGDAPPPVTLPADSALAVRYRAILDGLPSDTRQLLLIAAAGHGASPSILDAAATAAGTDLAALAPAEAAGLIRAGGPDLEFPEPVVRSIVYYAAAPAARRAAHAWLAEALSARGRQLPGLLHRARAAPGPDEDLAATLVEATADADHVTAAEAHELAAELTRSAEVAAAALTTAAGHAWLAGQPHRAGLLLRRALRRPSVRVGRDATRLAAEIGVRARHDRTARDELMAEARRLAGHDLAAALDALLLAGDAFALAGEHDRYAEVARAALALRRSEAAAGADPLVALAFRHVAGLAAMFRGDHPAAFAELRQAIRIAAGVQDPSAWERAAVAGLLIGDGAAAGELATRAVAVARARGETALVPQGLETAAFAALAGGHYAPAAEIATEGAALARATGQLPLAQSHLAILAVLAALAGDRESCLLRIREAGVRDSAEGPDQARSLCEWALAVLDLVYDRPQSTVDRLLSLIAGPSGHGNVVMQVAATPHLVEAAVRGRVPVPLHELSAPFDSWAGHTGKPGWLALRERCRALQAAEGRTAERHFTEALHHHRCGDADFPRAHTELLFGRELRRRRRPVAAREHLRRAVETFRLLDAGPWAEQAGRELRAAGEPAGQHPADAPGLTAQQERIARLVAEGATNREIAAQMFLSPRTVDHHLRNVFARLGVRSRTELARLIPAG